MFVYERERGYWVARRVGVQSLEVFRETSLSETACCELV